MTAAKRFRNGRTWRFLRIAAVAGKTAAALPGDVRTPCHTTGPPDSAGSWRAPNSGWIDTGRALAKSEAERPPYGQPRQHRILFLLCSIDCVRSLHQPRRNIVME